MVLLASPRGGGRWLEAEDAAEHSTMHGTAPTAKNYPEEPSQTWAVLK